MRWAFSSVRFEKVLGNREEAALVGRCWIWMGPSQVLKGKAGRCPQNATEYAQIVRCGDFLIGSYNCNLNVRIFFFQIKLF